MIGLCAWCRCELATTARSDSRFCGRKCRQTAFRLRRRHATVEATDRPMAFAYADPPYPGHARLYRNEPTFAGEVDHAALIASLRSQTTLGGWALSTSAKALRELLPLCPEGARVCAWVKPHEPSPLTYGLHNCWEPLIVVGGRQLRPGRRDWLSAMPARMGGELPGRKPIAFCAWLFGCLGMRPGDYLYDLFPGTGVVSKAWEEVSRAAAGDSCRSVHERHEPSPLEQRQLSSEYSRYVSLPPAGDSSPVPGCDTSSGAGENGGNP